MSKKAEFDANTLWESSPTESTFNFIVEKSKENSKESLSALAVLVRLYSQGFKSLNFRVLKNLTKAKKMLNICEEKAGATPFRHHRLLLLVQEHEDSNPEDKKKLEIAIEKLAEQIVSAKQATAETHFVLGVYFSRKAEIQHCALQLVEASKLGHLRAFLNYVSLEMDFLANKSKRMKELIAGFLEPMLQKTVEKNEEKQQIENAEA